MIYGDGRVLGVALFEPDIVKSDWLPQVPSFQNMIANVNIKCKHINHILAFSCRSILNLRGNNTCSNVMLSLRKETGEEKKCNSGSLFSQNSKT